MPWYVNLVIVLWFVVAGALTQKEFFYAFGVGWAVGYATYLLIKLNEVNGV